MTWIRSVLKWLLSVIQSSQAKSIMVQAIELYPYLEPIVKDIDEILKPLLKDNPIYEALVVFLTRFDLEKDLIEQKAAEFEKYEKHVMYAEIALLIASRLFPQKSLSIVKLAIELAYTLYKATTK